MVEYGLLSWALVQTLGLPMVLLTHTTLTFCQCFLSNDTRKLAPAKGAHKLDTCRLHLADSQCQIEQLLYLELDRGLHFINFGHHVRTAGQQGRGTGQPCLGLGPGFVGSA